MPPPTNNAPFSKFLTCDIGGDLGYAADPKNSLRLWLPILLEFSSPVYLPSPRRFRHLVPTSATGQHWTKIDTAPPVGAWK